MGFPCPQSLLSGVYVAHVDITIFMFDWSLVTLKLWKMIQENVHAFQRFGRHEKSILDLCLSVVIVPTMSLLPNTDAITAPGCMELIPALVRVKTK